MRYNRADLLAKLAAVQPGLAKREIEEQSSCFVFKDNRVLTYNGEVACALECKADFECAVAAEPLMALLTKLPDEELEIGPGKPGELAVAGKGKKAGIQMEATVMLPYDKVELAGNWVPLEKTWLEGVDVVQQCAGSNIDKIGFALTCVHIHPEYLEACDNYQVARYRVGTPIARRTLVRQSSLRHLPQLGVHEMSESKAWLHFRNASGLTFSCRRYLDEYHPVDAALAKDGGIKATLPGGLAEAVGVAQIFSADNPNDRVLIELRPNKLRISGRGPRGNYSEVKAVVYDGEAISFLISPKLINGVTQRHTECLLLPGRLVVDTGKYIYMTCLGATETPEAPAAA